MFTHRCLVQLALFFSKFNLHHVPAKMKVIMIGIFVISLNLLKNNKSIYIKL